MKIDVPLDENGFLPDLYGKYAPADATIDGDPCVSFPITVADVPEGAQALALTLVDWDSVPVCGFPWIHWCATDIPVVGLVPENASQSGALPMTQGSNSHAATSDDPALTQRYTGPCPPDKTHDYTLRVFALDAPLGLEEGYYLNEFRHAVKGHVLGSARLELPSRA